MVSAREVAELLDERPDLEPAIEAVLETDPPWTFHDIDVDSGRFGELVARGVVEETDGGYRMADRDAAERALAGDVRTTADEPDWTFSTGAHSDTHDSSRTYGRNTTRGRSSWDG